MTQSNDKQPYPQSSKIKKLAIRIGVKVHYTVCPLKMSPDIEIIITVFKLEVGALMEFLTIG